MHALPQSTTGRAHARVEPHARKHARKSTHTRAHTRPSRADAHTLLRRRAAAERRAMRVANVLAFKQKPDPEKVKGLDTSLKRYPLCPLRTP